MIETFTRCAREGETTCSSCDHDHDCEACDGTGKMRGDGSIYEDPPTPGEGEEVIIAIVDDRKPKGPRIAYPSIEDANHALGVLRELPDETLASFFTGLRAA